MFSSNARAFRFEVVVRRNSIDAIGPSIRRPPVIDQAEARAELNEASVSSNSSRRDIEQGNRRSRVVLIFGVA